MIVRTFLLFILLDIFSLNLKGLETGKNVTESRTNFNFDEVDLANETVKNQNMNEFDNNNEFLNKSKQILTVNATTVIYNVPPSSSTQQTTIMHHPSPTSDLSTDKCFITKESSSGHVTSPLHHDHRELIQCHWMIIVPESHRIRLKFIIFDLPASSNNICVEGFLIYGSFNDENQTIDVSMLCGKEVPQDYMSATNKCWLYFQTTHHEASNKFELIFEAIPPPNVIQDSSSDVLWSLISLILLFPLTFFIYVMYKRWQSGKKTEAEIFQRFKKKHMDPRGIMRQHGFKRNENGFQFKVTNPSDEEQNQNRLYIDTVKPNYRDSGEYAMVPGQFHVRRVLMTSACSPDGSVFFQDTPAVLKSPHHSLNFNYNHNFLSIPCKFNHMEPLPSYMSFTQPSSNNSMDNTIESDGNIDVQQTTAAMVTNNVTQNGSTDSLDVIPDVPPYKDPPAFQNQTNGVCSNNRSDFSNKYMPSMVSDTSVFSNKHPMTLDRKKKRRKPYTSTSLMHSGNRRRSKYYSLTMNDISKMSFQSARSRVSTRSKEDSYSYRPGTGHTKFLSSSSITNGNKFFPSRNLKKGKWDDIHCLNKTDCGPSSDNHCSLQNLSEMHDMCKTMPVIHVSSYSSIFQEHNTLSYSTHPTSLMTSASSHKENISLISEENSSGMNREFDNPAFEMDESPLQENNKSKFQHTCSVEENQSYVDINNNTNGNEILEKNKSFVFNKFCPGENNIIILDQGETIV